ncbi:tetratricopeptide repeat protein [Candidatus Latescibacterota bacterium]
MTSSRGALVLACVAAASCQPRDVAHIEAGDAFLQAGKPAAAAQEYQAAVELDPENADYLVKLASALVADYRVEEALRYLLEAIKHDPRFWPARYYLGNALVRSGKLTEAVEEYRMALDLNPTEPAVHVNLGNTYAQLGRTAEAREAYMKGLELDPTSGVIQESLAGLP